MGYGTGATLKATTDAYNEGVVRNENLKRSEQERELAKKRDARADEQMGMQRESFGMQRELFDRQTKLFNDQQERETLQRELNRGMATLKATGGQVYQPLVDAYNNLMPDGGRINTMTRNPDGSFDIEYDHGGKRMSLSGQSLEEVGSFFMSMSDPEGFLNMQREIAASAAEQAAAERLERLKADLRNRPSPSQYAGAYKEYNDIYSKAFTAGDGLGGLGEPLPGAPPREQWINQRMAEAGFTAGGGEGGAVPGPGGEQRQKGLAALADAFSSMPRLREWLREGGLPVEELMETMGGSARLLELENAMTRNDEQSMAVLEKHIREMAGRLGLADISPEEIAQIAGNRRHIPSGQSPDMYGGAVGTARIIGEELQNAASGVRSIPQWLMAGQQQLSAAGPGVTPSQDAAGRVGPRPPGAEAQIIGPNEQVIPAQPPPQQGVLPTPPQQGVTQVSPSSYYRRAYGR